LPRSTLGGADVGALHQRGHSDHGGRGFHGSGNESVADIGDAYKLLSAAARTSAAGVLFAIALLCSGQNATLTGTLAGQIVMEGFVNIRLRPWLRRLITRLVAIVPAIIRSRCYGEQGTGALLILSQVDPEPSVVVRSVSAGELYVESRQDGGSRRPAMDVRCWPGRSRLSLRP
jgi:hypothetical protein